MENLKGVTIPQFKQTDLGHAIMGDSPKSTIEDCKECPDYERCVKAKSPLLNTDICKKFFIK